MKYYNTKPKFSSFFSDIKIHLFRYIFCSFQSNIFKILKSPNFPSNFTNDQLLIKLITNSFNPKKSWKNRIFAQTSRHCKMETVLEWTDIAFVEFVAKAKFIASRYLKIPTLQICLNSKTFYSIFLECKENQKNT